MTDLTPDTARDIYAKAKARTRIGQASQQSAYRRASIEFDFMIARIKQETREATLLEAQNAVIKQAT